LLNNGRPDDGIPIMNGLDIFIHFIEHNLIHSFLTEVVEVNN